jgi:hypothetical protein
MSIGSYYMRIDGNWVRTDSGWRDFETNFLVDICHGGSVLVDERYYFDDLPSALDFYVEGWEQRQYVDDGNGVGLDHKGLYSRGRLIHGHSIYGDVPGHEGDNLRQICEALVKKMNQGENI